MIKSLRDTLSTNIVQQAVGVVMFLLLPNILTVNDYAKIVFISVLLSFSMVSDMGISLVYSRKLPGLHHANERSEIAIWMSSVFWFLSFSSFAFGVVITVFYLIKYGEALVGLFLVVLPISMAVTSFLVSTYSSTGDFRTYRNINISSSIARLCGIPLVLQFGTVGWIQSSVLANLVGMRFSPSKIVPPIKDVRLELIFEHLKEGIALGVIALVWQQLMTTGRLLASINYDSQLIAGYGLVNSATQIVVSILIALHVPLSVQVLKIVHVNRSQALDFVFKVLNISMPLVLIGAIVAAEVSPLLFELFFEKYNLDTQVILYLVGSLIFLPPMLILGNLFVGTQKLMPYFLILIFSVALNFIFFEILGAQANHASAALSQFMTMGFCSLGMLTFTVMIFRNEMYQWWKSIFPIVSYYLIFIFFVVNRS